MCGGWLADRPGAGGSSNLVDGPGGSSNQEATRKIIQAPGIKDE